MASRASAAKKIKIKDLPKIGADDYSMIALNNLVVYAVHYLQEYKVTATVEEIVSICFRLFPQSFALKNFPRWPDSALVIRRVNDGREKEHIKGNSMDGFSLKYKGKQLAKRVAKVLGLVQPAKIKKKVAPAKKKTALVDPVQVKAKRTKIVSQKKKIIAPVAIKKTYKERPSSQAIKAKQGTLPLIRAEEKPSKKSVKSSAPVPVKKSHKQAQRPAQRAVSALIKKKQQKQAAAKIAQSEQLTMALLMPQEKKAKPVVQSHVSKEEKIKAGKFAHLMERSDAYVHYKKNGKNAKIGEFDFRSLLLCTMESSRETLVKNVALFKRYAGIHNRQDLLIFLSHCEDRFSYLLKPQNKSERKAKK